MKENQKDKLIQEIPETEQGRINFVKYARKQITEYRKQAEKLEFVIGYINENY